MSDCIFTAACLSLGTALEPRSHPLNSKQICIKKTNYHPSLVVTAVVWLPRSRAHLGRGWRAAGRGGRGQAKQTQQRLSTHAYAAWLRPGGFPGAEFSGGSKGGEKLLFSKLGANFANTFLENEVFQWKMDHCYNVLPRCNVSCYLNYETCTMYTHQHMK